MSFGGLSFEHCMVTNRIAVDLESSIRIPEMASVVWTETTV